MENNLKIYVVPVGATMRDIFCQELAESDYGEGVMILPTGLLQEQTRQKFNVPVSGFDTLANKILNLNGYAYLEEINYRSQQLVVKETLDYYAELGQFQYLAVLKEKGGFVKHMTALLSQLSRSGATAKEISNALTSWGRSGNLRRKDQEIALVYQGYRNMLQLQKRFDLEGKYRLALKILKKQTHPKLPWSKIFVSDFATFDSLQLEFLKELAKHCQIKLGISYEKDKAVCAVSKISVEQLEKSTVSLTHPGISANRKTALTHLLTNLGEMHATKMSLGEEKSLVVREFKHQQAEIRAVLAEIKQELLAGGNIRDYAVAVYDLNNYTGIRLIADEYGMPLTLPKTEQLLIQPLTEFVLKLLEAVPDNRQGVEAYFSLLTSSLGKLLFNSSLEGMVCLKEEIFFKQRSVVQAKVKDKLLAYEKPETLQKIDEFLLKCKARDTLSGYVEILKIFIADLHLAEELGRLYKQGKITLIGLQTILQTEKKLLESLKSLQSDYEKCGMAEKIYSLQEFVGFWKDGIEEMSILLAEGRKDGLLVTNAVQLQGASFKKVYLLGLREGEFPAGNRENWLYNDKERGILQGLGIDLPNTYNAYAADYCLFAGVVATARESLVLSYYKDEEAEESPYIDEVRNIFTDLQTEKVEESSLASFGEALNKSACCEPAWLEQQVGALTLKAAQLDNQRTGLYNGLLEESDLVTAFSKDGRNRFSASGLAQYVSCPFKYLGTQLWQQQKAGEKAEQLDGGTRGSLFHDTVAKFVNSYLLQKPNEKSQADLWRELIEIYENKVEEYQSNGRVLINEYWPLESSRLEKMFAWWLDYEMKEQQQWADFKPLAVEQGFGGKDICLETEEQKTVYLTGRIDRIDASTESVFITDYKSGLAPANGDFEKGNDLQMAFYLLAAEKLCPEKTILGGDYLSLKKHTRQGGVAWSNTGNVNIKVNGKKNAPTYGSWDEVKKACEAMVLKPVTEIYKGHFAVMPQDKDACTYCPLQDICRHDVLAQRTVVKGEEVEWNGKATADRATTGDN